MDFYTDHGAEKPVLKRKKSELPERVAGSSYVQPDVQCPFYRCDDGQRRIVCEGFVEDSSFTQSYRFNHLYKKQMELFCCAHYKNCEVYRMLMEKYEM